jgi:hypothetical protein
MSKIEQPDLDGFDKILSEAEQSDIPTIETQKHLAKWGLKFERYASFSKDPLYKRSMFEQRRKCFDMMNIKERS